MKILRSIFATGALLSALAVGSAHAAVFTPGTVDAPSPPGNGFPRWYTDPNGLSLAPCLSPTDIGTGGPLCVLLADPGFVPTNAVKFPDNFPSETFYAIADALVDLTVDGKNSAKYRAALEGAFTNGVVQAGQQMAFTRVRYTIDAPVAGNYRITHPFGQKVFLNVTQGPAAIKVQDDVVGAGIVSAIDTAAAAPGMETMQAFLRRATGNITVGNETFIGDPNVNQKVLGATQVIGGQPFNAFRVEIDADKDGNYEQSFTTDNFLVAGQMIGLTITPPIAGTDFGAWQLTTPSTAKTFTVTNISGSILNLDLASFASSDPQFAVTATTCAQLLAGATCTFDAVFTPATNGAKTADITVSGGGVVPPAVVTLTGTGDSIPPTITISAPANSGFTNDTTPLLTYSVSDGTVVVLVDGQIVPKVSGDSLATLGEGPHTVRVESTDTAGNVGFAESNFNIDTVPPTATISNTPANPTKITGATLTVAGDQVVSYQVKHNNGTFGAVTPVANPIVLSGLAEGTHTISVIGRDAAGNIQGTATVVSWVVDTTPPALAVTTSNLLTKVNSLALQGTVETGLLPVVNAGTASAGVVDEINGTWNVIVSNLHEGDNAITITATDAAGNVSTLNRTITLDTIPPTYGIAGTPLSPTKTKTASLTVTGAEVATYQVKVDAGGFSSDIPAATPISLSGLSDGVHTVTVTAKDQAGNQGSEVSTSWTVDTTPPALALTPPPVSTSLNTMPISGTVESGITPVVTTNTGASAQVQVNGTTWTATLSNLVTGLNTITVTATDTAGNSTSASATIAAGSYAVTATAGTGGTVSPSGMSAYLLGSAKTYTFTPAPHYHVSDVIVDGVSKGARPSFRLTNINNDHTISVVFALDTYAVKATAGAGGTVVPTVIGNVEHGADKTFAITPKPGYHIVDVLVNGASIGPVSTYTFQNVTGPGQKISAKFSKTWTISLRKSGKGTVVGGIIAKVLEGASKTYTIKPAAGYQLAEITLDGVSIKNTLVNNKLTITNVTAHHDLNVTFTPVL